MTVIRIDPMRERVPDLLTRPPRGGSDIVDDWSNLLVDRVRQVEALADLFAMGLLSRDEFDRFKRELIAR